MDTISVIIPIHNVEPYLPRCLDSLLAQSHSSWEALCVDDGSTDGSGAILDKYAAADSRFKAVHTPGEGVSGARNRALDMASGKWLMFLDSDDFLHPQTMEICLTIAGRDHSSAVAFTYNRKYRTNLTIRHFLRIPEPDAVKFRKYDIASIPSKVFDDIFDCATEYVRPRDIPAKWAVKHCQPWRALYLRENTGALRFEPGIIYEDFLWWSEVLLCLGKTSVINLPLYYYYPNWKGYIHSADQSYRIESLKKAIAKAEAVYNQKADSRQKEKWEANFLEPFRRKLEKKVARFSGK